jgi:hypothetical protein
MLVRQVYDERYPGIEPVAMQLFEVFGTENRAAVDNLLGPAQVAALVADQHTALTAVHAFSVERSVAVIRMTDEFRVACRS